MVDQTLLFSIPAKRIADGAEVSLNVYDGGSRDVPETGNGPTDLGSEWTPNGRVRVSRYDVEVDGVWPGAVEIRKWMVEVNRDNRDAFIRNEIISNLWFAGYEASA